MARLTKKIIIDDNNRDKGKTFILTEMSSDQGERWAIRALLALANAGAQIPEDFGQAGMAAIATMGVEALARLPFREAEPLLDEMWGCIQYQHSSHLPLQPIMGGENSQIEEVMTRLKLRMELLQLHFSPFLKEKQSTSVSASSTSAG